MGRKRISAELEKRVRKAAGNRCGYCLVSQQHIPTKLEIEHIEPKSKDGSDDESNLWLACGACNKFKGKKVDGYDAVTKRVVSLFNPRRQKWATHFKWSSDGIMIIGITAVGRVTVEALKLNNELALGARRVWVSVGLHPPKIK